MTNFLLSVVIPVYNEEKIIWDSIQKILYVLKQAGIVNEIILIDDGSKDQSWLEINRLTQQYPNITAIKFSRNFGKESAICAGLDRVQGDCCVVMDADMQHPPEYIPKMVYMWKNEGYEIIEGIKQSRGKEPLLKKIGAWFFYKFLNKLSGINLENASDFRLMDQKVLAAWKLMPERDTFFRAMSTWVGFNKGSITIEIAPRSAGNSKWSLTRLFCLAIDAITSFSVIPLQIVTILGFIFLTVSLILGVQTLVVKFLGLSTEGFTTVILLLLIIGSILMISLGIIGVYLAKIYEEVKQRPRYIVSQIIPKAEQATSKTKNIARRDVFI
ncbi:MAG TPA: glycosyltransferase family 2 protein [Bacillota bacterium]|nr:glycosyltransferase family 2 protein [Bacillota bacterium]